MKLMELNPLKESNDYKYYELFIGPNHPGIEGNFSYVLKMKGHSVEEVTPDPGLLHRGFEKLMERRLWTQNLALIPRICVPEPDINEVAYCLGVEHMMGIEVPKRAQYIRVIVLELARMASFLFGMSGLGGTTGHYTSVQWLIGDRDYILDLFEWLTGARVYHIYQYPGGVKNDLPDGWLDKLSDFLDYLEKRLPEYDKFIFQNPIIQKRTVGLGYIPAEDAIENGLTGPNLRASGVMYDIRKAQPYLVYNEVDFEIPKTGDGDAFSRVLQRRLELSESIKILRQCIKQIPQGPHRTKVPNPFQFRVPKGSYYSKVESSRGEFGYYIVSDGDVKPYRVYVRGPSYSIGLYYATKALVGMRIEDVPVWIHTTDMCPPDFDR
jgi:NADH-quinone oxidoreductase subunit D